jgi:hypothetical protein
VYHTLSHLELIALLGLTRTAIKIRIYKYKFVFLITTDYGLASGRIGILPAAGQHNA